MILIASLIVTSLGALYSFLAYKYESFRTFAGMDKYMFSLLLSIVFYLINSIIVNLDIPKKFSFFLLFLFNFILIASISFLYENFSIIVESSTGNNLSWKDLSKMTKELYDKQVKETSTILLILRNALIISISFLLLKNVMYSNYILISLNFFIIKFLVFQILDKDKVAKLNNFRQQKSITLYNSNKNLDELATTILCPEWNNMSKDDLIQKIVNTVKGPSNTITFDTNTYLRIITNEQLNKIMQFIINSCDIILFKNSDDTILLTFAIADENDLNNLYIAKNDSYNKALEEKTYLAIDDPTITETYNYHYTDTSQPSCCIQNNIKTMLNIKKNKKIILSLLSTNFNDVEISDDDEYTKFFENTDNLKLFSNYNEVIKPYSNNSARIDIQKENTNQTFYLGTYTIDDNNNKVPHGIGFLYEIDNKEQIGLIGRCYYLYGIVVKLEIVNADFFFPVMNPKNKLLTDEFGHVIIYPITKKCLTDSYENLLKASNTDQPIDENGIKDRIIEFETNRNTYLNASVSALSPTNVTSLTTMDISDNPQDVKLTIWERFYALSRFLSTKEAKTEKLIRMSSKYRCDITRNNKCGPQKDNNLKIKLIQKEYEEALKKEIFKNLKKDENISTDFSFNELFCDFSCTSHAIYLFQYMNFENISNYSILQFYLDKNINFESSIKNLNWNTIYKKLKHLLENKDNICFWKESDKDLFNIIRTTLKNFLNQLPTTTSNFNDDIYIPYTRIPDRLNENSITKILLPDDKPNGKPNMKPFDISSFDMVLHLIFFNFIKASTKLKYVNNSEDKYKQYNTCLTTLTSITLLIIYLQNQINSTPYILEISPCGDSTSSNSDKYQQKLMCFRDQVELEYYDNDYTPYTEEIANTVQDIKKNMLKIIKKVNGNTINNKIYLQNIYLELSKDKLKKEGFFSGYQKTQPLFYSTESDKILKNYADNYYILKSIVFFVNDELNKPIMSTKDNYYVNLQIFLNNVYNVVDVKTKICDRIKFYKTEDTIDDIYKMFINKSFPFEENPYLVRIDYNEYYSIKNFEGDIIEDVNEDFRTLDKKTANFKYFNILFSTDTIKNISDKLESIKLFSNSLFMYNKVSNECKGTYSIIDNEKIIKQAVSNNVCTLKYAPDKLKHDVDVLYSALSSNNDKYVLSNFWTRYVHNNEVLTEKLLKKNGLFLQYDNWGLEKDKSIILIAVKQNGMVLDYTSDALKSDQEVVLAAVTQNGNALRYASRELQNDREVVLAAVRQNGMALQYASEDLKRDQEVVLAAVKQDGWALQFASEEVQNDRAVVLAAVKKEGMALRYASDGLKADKNLVLTAVSNNGLALESSLVYQAFDDLENLEKDNDIVKNAVEQNGLALKFAGKYFIKKKTNRDWIKDQIIQDGTMFIFLFDSNIDSNVKDFVEENFWSEIGTEKLCSNFNLIYYDCTKLKDLQKNIETIFGGTEREEVSKNLIKLFEVSMEHFSDDDKNSEEVINWYFNDDKNSEEVINWYFKMGLFEKYEMLFRVAVKNYMFVTIKDTSYLRKLLQKNYPALLKDVAIQRPDIIFHKDFRGKTDNFGGLFSLLEESTEKNGKKVMELFKLTIIIDKNRETPLRDPKKFNSVFGMLTHKAIRSNWESLKEIVDYDDYHKIISKTIEWNLVYEAVKENFAAIQYIKDRALIVNI